MSFSCAPPSELTAVKGPCIAVVGGREAAGGTAASTARGQKRQLHDVKLEVLVKL